MFGLSVATELIQGSTERTWNCVLHFAHSLWSKLNYKSQPIMPKSRKRHHSRSRSRSRSHSRDRSRERDDKHKKNDSYEKDRDGKRRKIDSYDSPTNKRSVSEDLQDHQILQQSLEDSQIELKTQIDEAGQASHDKGEQDLSPSAANAIILDTKDATEDIDTNKSEDLADCEDSETTNSAGKQDVTPIIEEPAIQSVTQNEENRENIKDCGIKSKDLVKKISEEEIKSTSNGFSEDKKDIKTVEITEIGGVLVRIDGEEKDNITTNIIPVIETIPKPTSSSTKRENTDKRKESDELTGIVEFNDETDVAPKINKQLFMETDKADKNDEQYPKVTSNHENKEIGSGEKYINEQLGEPMEVAIMDEVPKVNKQLFNEQIESKTHDSSIDKIDECTREIDNKKTEEPMEVIELDDEIDEVSKIKEPPEIVVIDEAPKVNKQLFNENIQSKTDCSSIGNSDECTRETDNKKMGESMEVIELDDEIDEVSKIKEPPVVEKICASTFDTSITKRNSLNITPKKVSSPKNIQKKLESEKKRMERQKEKEERERQRKEERDRIQQEKQKKKEEKQREVELKQKEKEMKEEQKQKEKELKEEQKRKEREEKEQKRKEKEEKEEQKRKEKEQDKLKKQEKELEKQREEEKKQKAAAAFVNFFVPKKTDNPPEEKKCEEVQSSLFMAFEVKSEMKLPPARRQALTEKQAGILDNYLKEQDDSVTYLKDLKSGKVIGKSPKTWPYEEESNDDVEIIEEESGSVCENICEDEKPQKCRAKFLKFHENRRPAYFGTWRKKSKYITPRKPLAEDNDTFNYEEDSGDDWEEEEQGESLNGSDDEADKEIEDEKDDYEVDNEFFVPHGHLSDDEVDDEENKRMSPESMKQKLKLLKDEFELDLKSKTHKLKSKAIGCIWYKRDGSNVDEAIHKYLHPLAIICRGGSIEMKCRSDIFVAGRAKQKKQLNPDVIPLFLKYVHGCEERKKNMFEKFKTHMAENGSTLEFSKRSLLGYLSEVASWRKEDAGPSKNKMVWVVNADTRKKYNLDVE